MLFVELRDSAGSAIDPHRLLGRFLRDLGTPHRSIPPDLEERAALYRTVCSESRVLVVLDDARSPSQVRPLLPNGPRCAVLVTSRRDLLGPGAARHLGLRPFDDDEARALLAAILGGAVVAANESAIGQVIAACGGLPFALRSGAAQLSGWPG